MKKGTSLDSRKGQIGAEPILVMIVLVVFSIIGVITFQVFDELNTDIQADTTLSNTTKTTVEDLKTRYPSTIDGAFALIMTLLIIFSMVLARFAQNRPIFLFIPVLILAALLMVAGFLSNTWDELTDDADITFENQFPIMNWVLDNLLVVILATGFLVALAMFVNNRGGL